MSIVTVRNKTLFKWDEDSRVDVQLSEEAAAAKNQRQVYAHVTAREENGCRICGVWCNPEAKTLLKKGHHHHVIYESAGGPTTVENVCLLCARCHNDEHQHRIRIEGNAEGDPWLTLSKKHAVTKQWYVARQEIGVRIYERD